MSQADWGATPQILWHVMDIQSANGMFVCCNEESQERIHIRPAPCPQILWRIRKSGSDGEQHVRCSTNKKAVRYMACVCALHRTSHTFLIRAH